VTNKNMELLEGQVASINYSRSPVPGWYFHFLSSEGLSFPGHFRGLEVQSWVRT
jgi:hypothetical protein